MSQNIAHFSIDANEMFLLEERIKAIPDAAEQVVNAYLHDEGAEIIVKEVTSLIRRSRGTTPKTHAKDSKWYKVETEHLAVTVKSRGGAANKKGSYGYLVFPDEGRGPRNPLEQNFSNVGLMVATPKIVEKLHERLNIIIQEAIQ